MGNEREKEHNVRMSLPVHDRLVKAAKRDSVTQKGLIGKLVDCYYHGRIELPEEDREELILKCPDDARKKKEIWTNISKVVKATLPATMDDLLYEVSRQTAYSAPGQLRACLKNNFKGCIETDDEGVIHLIKDPASDKEVREQLKNKDKRMKKKAEEAPVIKKKIRRKKRKKTE